MKYTSTFAQQPMIFSLSFSIFYFATTSVGLYLSECSPSFLSLSLSLLLKIGPRTSIAGEREKVSLSPQESNRNLIPPDKNKVLLVETRLTTPAQAALSLFPSLSTSSVWSGNIMKGGKIRGKRLVVVPACRRVKKVLFFHVQRQTRP